MADDDLKPLRRLSVILLADMKDYSAVMGQDEAHAIAGVDDVGSVFARIVPKHGGSYEITSGDRFFAIFDSAVEALEAAMEIQRDLAGAGVPRGRALSIRIGIHLGEVVQTPFGWQGDAINVAARIQSIAEPGGISVSDDIHRAVRSRLTDVVFRYTGAHKLKNIREPVRVYVVVLPRDGAGTIRPWTGWTEHARHRRSILAGGVAVIVAGVGWAMWRRFPGAVTLGGWTQTTPRIAKNEGPLVLGVMAVRSSGDVPQWMSDFTRDGLNTVLSGQPNLLVYSRQKIDFLCEKRGLKEIEAAEELGISKMISVTLSAVESVLALQVQIIDIKTGLIEGSNETHGSNTQLIEMQNNAAVDVMRALKVPIDVSELTKVLAKRTNDRLDDYKLLTESMGGTVEDAPAPGDPHSRAPQWDWPSLGPPSAFATGSDEADIRTLLEQYRTALESENMSQVEAVHVRLPDAMRDALGRYFQNAKRLQVHFSKVDIVVEGDEALATFTRSDDFLDAETGLPVHLEVRVSNVVARQGAGWRIRGLKGP